MTTHDRTRTRLLQLALAMVATVACSASPSTSTGVVDTTGSIGAGGGRAAGELLEQAIAPLGRNAAAGVVSINGEELDLTDPTVAALIESYGADPGDVEIAAAFLPAVGGPSFLAGAIRVPGKDWGPVLDVLADPSYGATYEWMEIAGRRVLRAISSEDPGRPPVVYVSVGDAVLYIQSSNKTAVESAIETLPAVQERGDPTASDPPVPGTFPLMLVVLQQPLQPVCVAEPAGRQRLDVIAIDTGLGIPYPYNTFFVSGRLMGPVPDFQVGPMASYEYTAVSYGFDGREQVQIGAISIAGGQGQATLDFDVRHCLEGTWQDGDRVVRVTPPYSEAITAEVISGEICGEEGGIDFSGTLLGDQLTGDDLKVCNPEECVDAGILPPSVLVPFSGRVADDGQSVTIDWVGDYYQFEEDSQGNVVSCAATSTENHQFTITRLTFGA